MTYYIYSTHTNPVQYVEYEPNAGKNHNVIKRRFRVEGGHGMCLKNLITPTTSITVVEREEDMEWLNTVEAFQADIKKGYIHVQKRKEEGEKVFNKGMNPKDKSAPLTPADYKPVEGEKNTYKCNSTGSIL